MALVGYEQEKIRIEAQIADIHSRLGTANPSFTVTAGTAPKKRRLSAAARKRISAATTARWLAFRKQKAEAEKPPEKPKRKLSAAGLRAIREATAKRWAAYRKTQKAATKKKAPVAEKGTPKPKARKPAAKAPVASTVAPAPVTA
jgi:hypothetical protein